MNLFLFCALKRFLYSCILTVLVVAFGSFHFWLEACIDDERQFKKANRPQAPSDATVRKRVFRDNFISS